MCGKQRTCGSGFSDVWQGKDLASSFLDLWQIKDLVTDGEDGKGKTEKPGLQKGQRVEKWQGSERAQQHGVESSQPMIIHVLQILSSLLLIFLVLVEFAEGTSFEQDLRKRKKTQG